MKKNEKEQTGGVYCEVCKKCLSKPRVRKYPIPAMYIKCEECENPLEPRKTLKDFSQQEKDIGDYAFDATMKHIQNVVKDYISKDDIKYEIWNAVSIGVKEFLEEYYDKIIEEVSDNLTTQISNAFSNIKVVL